MTAMTSTIESPPTEATATATNGAPAPKTRTPKPRARRGHVARLSKIVRDSINRMMDDGLSSRAILERLGPDCRGLNKHHLSEWRSGGYLDWQGDQQWLEEIRVQQQFGLELLQDQGVTKINQIVLQVAITQVLQTLRRIAPANLTGKFDTDAANFTRLLNSISRISRESLVFRKYDDAATRAAAIELQQRDPDRDLSASELSLLVNKMDKTFKVARPELARLLAEAAVVPPAKPELPSEGGPGGQNAPPAQTATS